MRMKRIFSYLLIFILAVVVSVISPHTAYAAESKAASVPARIYVNNAYQLTEAYKIGSGSEYYYKIQDIAASVRDLSVRFQFKMSGKDLAITTYKNHKLTGKEYSAADLKTYAVKEGGQIKVNEAAVDVTGYIINGDYCLSMKQAAKMLNCAFYALAKGKGSDNQLMTSYKYDSTGKRLERKLSETTGNTSNFNRMWEGFAASYKDSIYFLGNKGLTKMNNKGTKSQLLTSGVVRNINIANELIYYTIGNGKIYIMNLDGSENLKIQQYPVVNSENVASMLVIDDSVFYIYNNGSTNNIDTFDMVGRDMIVDSWSRQTLYSQKTAFIGEHRIDNFYYDDGYIYFGAQWISRFKLNDWNTPTTREVISKEEWYQVQKISANAFIQMGKNPGNTEYYKYWNRYFGYIYVLNKNTGKKAKVISDQIHTFTYAFDKLLYTDAQNKYLYSRDLLDTAGTTKTRIEVPGLKDNTVMRFNIAGDWIVCKSEGDLSVTMTSGNTVLVKLDGTTPTCEY